MNTIPYSRSGFLTPLILITVALSGCTPKPVAGDRAASDADAGKTGVPASAAFIRLHGTTQPIVEVAGLRPEELEALARLKQTDEQWQALFAVYVGRGSDATKRPAMLGSYRIEKDVLRFEPRFPLVPGLTYRAVFHPDRLPGRADSSERPVEKVLLLPKPETIATTVVERVYPSMNELPENQLKFYLHFSAPMSRGEAYEHIRLLRPDGKPDERAFLELPQELWDPEGKRLTLFIDPGRIKRGLKPREDLGPVLETGAIYTLVIDGNWKDAKGNPLKEGYSKTFRVLPPDETQPGPKMWTIEAPDAGTTMPFVMTSSKPLDHALLHRMVWISDAKGQKVPGRVEVTQEETCWRFTPAMPWKAGRYYLVADTRLEDLAGNSIARPFEVDGFHPNEQETKSETVRIPFEVP
jgi:hypothetical protein